MTQETATKPMIFIPASNRSNNAQYRLTLSTALYKFKGEEHNANSLHNQLVYNGDVPAIGIPEFPENTYDEIAYRLGAVLLTSGRYGLPSQTIRDVVVVKHVPTPADLERITLETESEIEDLSINIFEVPGSGLSPIAEMDLMETIPLEEKDHSNLFGFVFRVSMSPARG